MESNRGRLSLRKKKPLSRSIKPPLTSSGDSSTLSALSTSQVNIPKIRQVAKLDPLPNIEGEEENDFKMPRTEIPQLSEECLLSTIEEEQLQLAQALSASVEPGESVPAHLVVDNRKRKRKRGANSVRPPSPLLVLTTTPDEAQKLFQERAEQMITEETREEEFSCTPAFTVSSHDSADVGGATGKEMVGEKSAHVDTTEYQTMWELSKTGEDQDKEDFYVPALSQFVARPSPPVELPGVVGTCTGSLDTLSNALLTLVDCPSFSDLTVITKGGKKIHAHSAILSCRCPRMKEVLESSPNVLDLSAFSHSSVMTLLAFLYSATVPVSLGDEERQELITQAEIWGVEELVKICKDQLENESRNASDTVSLKPKSPSPLEAPSPTLKSPSLPLPSPLSLPPPSPLKSPSLPPPSPLKSPSPPLKSSSLLCSSSQFPSPYSISSSSPSRSPSQPPPSQPPTIHLQSPLSPPSHISPSQSPLAQPPSVPSQSPLSPPSHIPPSQSPLAQLPSPEPSSLPPSPLSVPRSFFSPADMTEVAETMITPANQQIPPESADTITPMPNYRTMATPHLKRQCSGFGVRGMPKKRMIAKLEEIYDYTHPLANERDTTEKEVENKEGGGKKLSKKTTKLQDSGSQERDVIQAIMTDTKLYNDILLFKPLQLSDIQLRLKSGTAPVSLSKEKLADILDQLCVTFTTPHDKPY